MPWQDMRQFIQALQETGDAVAVEKEVDWDLEAGAMGRRACEMEGPALWLKKVKDYPEGYALFLNPLATWRRMAVALGLRPDTPIKEIYAEYQRREGRPIPPVQVDWGPCKENIHLGDEVDLYQFPAPMIHEGDGGRYIGTLDLVVSQDPDTRWVNWGVYRFMIHNRNTLAGWPRPTGHLGKVLLDKYVPQNRPMPIALVIGADPISHMVAATTFPLGVAEADMAGALRGEPLPLVKCETNDLLVPAHAEIVIEGEILTDHIAMEGPFGEFAGYRTGEMGMGLLCRVTAITHRHNPILTVSCVGPRDDTSIITAMGAAITIKRRLERFGIPVTEVYVPPEGAVHVVIVGVKSGGREVVQKILELLTVRRADMSKVIVVDEDVDVFNLADVLHAFATKCHPGRGILVTHYEGKGQPLTPCYDQDERARGAGATVAFDCTWPPQWSRDTEVPVKATFDSIFSQEVRQRVLANWKSYGL